MPGRPARARLLKLALAILIAASGIMVRSPLTAYASSCSSSASVTGISVDHGGTAGGGSAITITGSGFGTSSGTHCTIKFGSTASATTTWVSSSSMTAVPPAESAGSVLVTASSGGTNSNNTYYYQSAPTVTGVSPAVGATGQNTEPPLGTSTTTTLVGSMPYGCTTNCQSAAGAVVTFTATVSAGSEPATGTVTVVDGGCAGTTLGTADLTTGIATYTTSSLTGGVHAICAAYNGDPNLHSSSATLTQTVGIPAGFGHISAFLASQLGTPSGNGSSANMLHPRGMDPNFSATGLQITSGSEILNLTAAGMGQGAWTTSDTGANRATPFGYETVVLRTAATEDYSTISTHQGQKTWTWSLPASLTAQVTDDGSIQLRHRSDGSPLGLTIAPVVIFDVNGANITPAGLKWSIATVHGATSFQLTLDDSNLPLPYVIDPTTYVTSVTFAPSAGYSAEAGATATWTVGFTSSSAGALTSTGTVTAIFASGFTVPTTTATITMLTGFTGTCAPTTSGTSPTITIVLGGTCALARSTAATFSIAGITNGTAQTYTPSTTSFAVNTSANTGAVAAGSNIVITAATSVTSVSFAPSTGYSAEAGATATWTVGFTTASAGALTGASTITVVFNTGFTVPGAPTVTTLTGFTGICTSASATAASQTVTITLNSTCALANSTAATLSIAGLTNPSSTGTLANTTFSVSTSRDATNAHPASGVTITADTPVTSVTFAPSTWSSAEAGATANWTVGFTTASAGALTSASTITVVFNSGFFVPSFPTITTLTGFTGTCTSASATTSGTTATITLNDTCALANSTAATLSIAGLTNPSSTGTLASTTFSVSTSMDATAVNPASGVTIAADTSVTAVTFAPSTGFSAEAGATAKWTVGFTTASAGALTSASTITVVFNTGFTVPAGPAITMLTGFTGTCTSGAATASSQTVTITLNGTCALANSTAATLSIARLTNPSTASTLTNTTFSVKTSMDATAVNPASNVTITAATSVTAVTFAPSTGFSAEAGATANWTVGFTPSSSGALVGASTITVVFDFFTFNVPASPTITLLTGFVSCTATATGASAVVTITLAGGSCALANSTAATLSIAGITNPSTAQTIAATGFSIRTSMDATTGANPASGVTITAATAVTLVTFAPSTGFSAETGAAANWTVGFTSGSAGALTSANTITVYMGSFGFNASPAVRLLTGFTGTCTAASATVSVVTVTITLNGTCALANSTAATVSIQAINPNGTGSYTTNSFAVNTSMDTTVVHPASAVTITADTSVTSVTFAPSAGYNANAGATANWTVGFTAASAGALVSASTITVVFNSAFTVPATPAITTLTGFTGTCTSAAATAVSTTVTITLNGTCALANSTAATLSIAGLTNPSSAGTLANTTFWVNTSMDTTAVNPASGVTITSSGTSVSFAAASPSPASPSAYGTSVSFYACLAPASGSTVPTGTVAFTDSLGGLPGTTSFSPVTATAPCTTGSGYGMATYTSSALSVSASHSITATYTASGSFTCSSCATSAQAYTINKATPTTTLTSSANPSTPGQTVTYTATVVAPGAGTPSGNVTFMDNGGNITLPTGCVSAALNGSAQATCAPTYTVTACASGCVASPHPITFSYAGDSNFNTVTSSTLTQTVAAGSLSATAPADVSLTSLTPGGTSAGNPLGDLSFGDSLGDNGAWSITVAATDLCLNSGCTKIIFFTNLAIGFGSSFTPGSNTTGGSPTAGTSGPTALSGGDGSHGATLSAALTAASGTAGQQGSWTQHNNTITVAVPANLASSGTLTATVQYTITG
jgi:large repetitive protein